MKKTLLLAAALAFCAGSAFAADLVPIQRKAVAAAPTPSWAGIYIGVNGGYGWSQSDVGVAGVDAAGQFAVGSGLVPSSLKTRSQGAFGGGQIGMNWQTGTLVYGGELDFQYGDITGTDSQTLAFGPFSLASMAKSRMDYFGTARLRGGVLLEPNTLLYATGGLAWGHVTTDAGVVLTTPGPVASASGSAGDTRVGWTAGAGIEHALTPNWTVKTEYLYVDLGSTTVTHGTTLFNVPVTFQSHQDDRFHLVRAGLNYRLPYSF